MDAESDASAKATSDQLQSYAKEKVERVLKAMLHDLFLATPDDPIDFMISYLQDYQERNSTASSAVSSSAPAPPPSELSHLPVIDTGGGQRRYNRSRRRVAVSAEPMSPEDEDSDGGGGEEEADGGGSVGSGGAKKPPRKEKSAEDVAHITAAVSGNILFSSLGPDEMRLVIDAMDSVEFAAGETVIRQGDDGDLFYVLDRGECECFVKFADAEEPLMVKLYQHGESFGELALMYNCPRAASIVAKTPVRVWAMGRRTFRKVLMNTTSEKRRRYDAFLQRVKLLETLDRYERSRIADALVEERYADGDCIIAQGDAGDALYMLLEGNARVMKALDGEHEPTEVLRYEAGDYFGELALLNDKPRAASVFAVDGPAVCVCLDRGAFTRLLGPLEAIMKRKSDLYDKVDRRVLARRRRAVCAEPPRSMMEDGAGGAGGAGGGAGGADRVVHPKTPEQERSIRAAVAGNFLFSSLEPEQMAVVLDAMFEKSFAEGEFVIRQGDDGDLFYVLDEGECECFVLAPDHAAPGLKVKHYRRGESFGELALMYNCPRAASIVAATPVVRVWCMDRVTFQRVIMTTTQRRSRMYEEFLAAVPLLSSLDAHERSQIADALEVVRYADGEHIIRQGEAGHEFYIVEEGRAAATKRLAPDDAEESEVYAYERGGFFGELALLHDQPRAANVVARGDCKCVRLDRGAFVRLLGPCEEILKRNRDQYDEVEKRLRGADEQ